jgi:hypothetical protein
MASITPEQDALMDRVTAAVLRPKRIVVDVAWRTDEEAAFTLPEGIRPLCARTVEAVAHYATRCLEKGWSHEYAISKLPAGRDVIRAELAQMGYEVDRKTVASALEEVCDLGLMERVGQLEQWTDPSAQGTKTDPVTKSGAFIYRLKLVFREFGDLAESVVRGLMAGNDALGGIWGQTKIEACLRGAIRHAKTGNRNSGGAFIAFRCRDYGLTYTDAQAVMARYQGSVPQHGHPYSLREAMATVRGVYKVKRAHPVDW